jgi:hypothetical protein
MSDNDIAQKGEPPANSETESEVSDAPCFADAQDQFDYWLEQFGALADKAAKDGINVVVCLGMHDPINHNAHWDYVHRGYALANQGLIERVREDFRYL